MPTGAIETVAVRVDVGLLREQRDWVISMLEACDSADTSGRRRAEGLLELLDAMLDIGEAA